MTNGGRELEEGDDDVLGRLVHAAGPRAPVAPERAGRVRAAVRAEWQARLDRRAANRRIIVAVAGLSAAAVLLVAVVTRLGLREPAAPLGVALAVVERIDGIVTHDDAPGARLAQGDEVRAGRWVQTAEKGRVALRLPNGTSVRLDVGTRLRPLSAGVLELAAGAVYVDVAPGSAQLEIRTAFGTARDIGTQFELRLVGRGLRLRVRRGAVELADRSRTVSGLEGTEVTWSESDITTRPVLRYGPEWDWVAGLAPPRDIEGVSLKAFVDDLARERGWTVRYGDRLLEREAADIVLHGSVRGLSPSEAVDVAVMTSGLRYTLNAGDLVILRGSGTSAR